MFLQYCPVQRTLVHMPSLYRRSSLAGFVVWSLAVFELNPGWGAALFLLAPLVLLPLGLALVVAPLRMDQNACLWRTALFLQPPAALALVAAFALPRGPGAAMLALPWLAFTSLLTLLGLRRLLNERPLSVENFCIDAGLVFLSIGGGWIVLSRAGIRPLGFSDIIVQATAVHFHYAGFVLPLLTGMGARVLRGVTAKIAAGAVVLGVPLVAVGITLSAFGVTVVELIAAWFLVSACLLVAFRQIVIARRMQPGLARVLLFVSSTSLALAMFVAGTYALDLYLGTKWLEITDMYPLHGAVNAFGFALMGLLAWSLIDVERLLAYSGTDWSVPIIAAPLSPTRELSCTCPGMQRKATEKV